MVVSGGERRRRGTTRIVTGIEQLGTGSRSFGTQDHVLTMADSFQWPSTDGERISAHFVLSTKSLLRFRGCSVPES